MVYDIEDIIRKHYPEFTGVHPAANLFPMLADEELADLIEDVKKSGLKYAIDKTPDGLLLDGRNRLIACYEAGQDIRTMVIHGDPVQAVVTANLKRRHMDASQRAMVAAKLRSYYDEVAKRRQSHGQTAPGKTLVEKIPQAINEPTKARDAAGQAVNVSGPYVDKARDVLTYGDEELVNQVERGKMNINKAHDMVKPIKEAIRKNSIQTPAVEKSEAVSVFGRSVKVVKPKKVTMNQTNDSIAWADWSWNPVVGCLHNCRFCYAREIAESERMKEFYPFGFEPCFFEYRLDAPANTKPITGGSNRVFLGSMCDLMGEWVPDAWLEKIFAKCAENPQWTFLILTKAPERYLRLPEHIITLKNVWFGATVTDQNMADRVESVMVKIYDKTVFTWVSMEPLLAQVEFQSLDWCNLVVIGSQTATVQTINGKRVQVPAIPARFEDVFDVVRQCRDYSVPYYLKPNLAKDPGMILPEFPIKSKEE